MENTSTIEESVMAELGARVSVSAAALAPWAAAVAYPQVTLAQVSEDVNRTEYAYACSPERLALMVSCVRQVHYASAAAPAPVADAVAQGARLVYPLVEPVHGIAARVTLDGLCDGAFAAASAAGVKSDEDFSKFCVDTVVPVTAGVRVAYEPRMVSADEAYARECARGRGMGLYAFPFWVDVARELHESVDVRDDAVRGLCELQVEGAIEGLFDKRVVKSAPILAVDMLRDQFESVHRRVSSYAHAVGLFGDAPQMDVGVVGALEFVLCAYRVHRDALVEHARCVA